MRLTKHHGLGNDFLVLDDPDGTRPITADLARAVCDRRRGIGADGLLRLAPASHGRQVTMELLNADGSRAEMSGNGISCLVQAALLAGRAAGPEVTVWTDAGERAVTAAPGDGPRTHLMTVDMGTAKVGDDDRAWTASALAPAARAAHVDMGNPHLVLLVEGFDGIDLDALGVAANEAIAGGTNVELVVSGPGPDEIRMQVYERGVGRTEACGTGASASAAAAVAWGLVPATLRVVQPGGTVAVTVGDPVRMTVPVVHVADVVWPEP